MNTIRLFVLVLFGLIISGCYSRDAVYTEYPPTHVYVSTGGYWYYNGGVRVWMPHRYTYRPPVVVRGRPAVVAPRHRR